MSGVVSWMGTHNVNFQVAIEVSYSWDYPEEGESDDGYSKVDVRADERDTRLG